MAPRPRLRCCLQTSGWLRALHRSGAGRGRWANQLGSIEKLIVDGYSDFCLKTRDSTPRSPKVCRGIDSRRRVLAHEGKWHKEELKWVGRGFSARRNVIHGRLQPVCRGRVISQPGRVMQRHQTNGMEFGCSICCSYAPRAKNATIAKHVLVADIMMGDA